MEPLLQHAVPAAEKHLLVVDGFQYPYFTKVWPRNTIGILSDDQIAEILTLRKKMRGPSQGTKKKWQS